MQEKIENELASRIYLSNKLGIISNSVFEKFLDFWDGVIAERADTAHKKEMAALTFKMKGVSRK